jgi:hypothetical protein
MKLYQTKFGPWEQSEFDERTYRFMYVSDEEQYIVFSDGEVCTYGPDEALYKKEAIDDFVESGLWVEVILKEAF